MKDEDQLLNFLNRLYKIDRKYCVLYEFVIFSNVTTNCIKEFLEVFDFNDLSSSTWKSISRRLQEEISDKNEAYLLVQIFYLALAKKISSGKDRIEINSYNLALIGIINFLNYQKSHKY